jgi:hypothetical protein
VLCYHCFAREWHPRGAVKQTDGTASKKGTETQFLAIMIKGCLKFSFILEMPCVGCCTSIHCCSSI